MKKQLGKCKKGSYRSVGAIESMGQTGGQGHDGTHGTSGLTGYEAWLFQMDWLKRS